MILKHPGLLAEISRHQPLPGIEHLRDDRSAGKLIAFVWVFTAISIAAIAVLS